MSTATTFDTITLEPALTGEQLADVMARTYGDRYVEFIGDTEHAGRQGAENFVIGITPQTPKHFGFLLYVDTNRTYVIRKDGLYTQLTLAPVFTRAEHEPSHEVIEDARSESLLFAIEIEDAARTFAQNSA